MKYSVLLLAFFLCLFSYGQVEVPLLFSDGMVLQQNQDIPVWGWAKAGEHIQVSFKDQKVITQADQNGNWKAILKPEVFGGPFVLEIKGSNTLTVKDVYVGEVWVCSGQSNMEWTVVNSLNAEAEMKAANFPLIRQFLVEKDMAMSPKTKLKGGNWSVCSPNTVADFTAVGYFFARNLHQELKVPVGIINSSWGGTCSETWTSTEALQTDEEFSKALSSIPTKNLDSLISVQRQKTVNKVEALQHMEIGSLDESKLSKEDYNFTSWPVLQVPDLWESQELGNLDGVVWFRKTVEINPEDEGKEAVLQLDKIDDNDITYVNGVQVGATNQYNTERIYQVPKGILKSGKNSIAVRITDTGGGGGIYGEASSVKLEIGNNTYPLSGAWNYYVHDVMVQFSPNSFPSLLYNAMLNPLIPYGIKGVIWYQGETNVGRAVQYKQAFPLMINDWRNHWQQGAFPFYFVQLSSFNQNNGNSNQGSAWAELREAQTYTWETVENTGMCVTTDVGEANDIHPRNKQDVGSRLAAIALNKDYGKNNMFSGPKFKSYKIEDNQIVLEFDYLGSGLKLEGNSKELNGFEIAGADKVFYKATATLKSNKVVVSSNKVKKPMAVRYGWSDDAGSCNLFNQEGFPAIPFRTDNWELTTQEAKYSVME
ncbi:MAG TPA: sialate O-acetylesterase [Flavobacteriaceae bacterium]|nr:sialate O-acetylesterase [Flavobacteriaceae bacterium]